MPSKLVAIAFLVAAGACAKKKEDPPVSASSAQPPAKPDKPDVANSASTVTVTAQQLYTDYRDNEVGADAKYLGKVVRVEGIVERVTKNALGDVYLVLRTSSESLRVQANFADEKVLIPLKAGQEIAIRCLGEGKVAAALMLVDCVLE